MSRHESSFRLPVFLDIFFILLSFKLALVFRDGLFNQFFENNLSFSFFSYIWVAFLSIAIHVVNFNYIDHKDELFLSLPQSSIKLLKTTMLEFIIIGALVFIMKEKLFSRSFLFIFLANKFFILMLGKTFLNSFLKAHIEKSRGAEGQVLLWIDESVSLAQQKQVASLYDKNKVLKTHMNLDEIVKTVHEDVVDCLVCIVPSLVYKNFENEILAIKQRGISINLILSDFPSITYGAPERKNGINIFPISKVNIGIYHSIFKQTIDLLLGLLGCIFCFFCLLIFFVPIKIQTRKSVIYKQKRLGKNGRIFNLYKFRTMKDTKEKIINEIDGPVFKMKDDPRVTPFGQFLRRSSLDELPQFVNVLKGEMSVIGPRPPIPEEVNKYENDFYLRLAVKPGITGYWQVYSRKKTTSFDQILNDDKYYISNMNVLLDIKIIFKTIGVIFFLEGK